MHQCNYNFKVMLLLEQYLPAFLHIIMIMMTSQDIIHNAIYLILIKIDCVTIPI